MRVSIEDGKYEYVFDNGHSEVLRYGESWRDCVGDKFIYCMAAEIESLRQQLAEKDTKIDQLKKQSARRLIGVCSGGEANDELRLQLAASQAREQQYLEALESVIEQCECDINPGRNDARDALALPTDTSALEAVKAKAAHEAGEVMRRMVLNVVPLPHWDDIQALPTVTMDDLK